MSEVNKAQALTAARAGGKASAARRAADAAKLVAFREHLERLDTKADPIKESLIDAACALYAPVLRRSHLSRGVNQRVNMLALSACVTGLRTILRDLGTLSAAEPSDPNSPPGGALAEYVARKATEGSTDAGNHDV